MSKLLRKRILVKGVVQGVGFRPNVYKLAAANGIRGWVKNDSAGVTIEAEGTGAGLENFISGLKLKSPPLSRLDSLSISTLLPLNEKKFVIVKSGGGAASSAIIPVDLALCADCRREMLNPEDRRYLYPFTNCTNCGPRFTIVKKLPYDRPFTTMAAFKMCPVCKAEYKNPLDRRFHAQPNACPVCGPSLEVRARGNIISGPAALEFAAGVILKGGIAAIQSLGGFHLACLASSVAAVTRLRKLKNRPHKPFAVMVSCVQAARAICHVSKREERELSSHRAPVVMIVKKNMALLSGAAPGLARAGVMLAYTPLHAALFELLRRRGNTCPLIMTSGNRRDEPIAKSPVEAGTKLKELADAVIFHNRAIHNRVDDSVVFVSKGETRLVRRARGFVPEAVKLKGNFGVSVLGCGADLKNTFCLTRGGEAFLSQHIGDLSEKLNQDFYAETLAKMKSLLKLKPGIIAYDPHPAYVSSAMAVSFQGVKAPVQHHAAHILSVAAERGLETPFIGAAFDGTGYGSDGKIWGGEFLVFESKTWRRAGHLKYFRLPGGEAAVREIWRGAFSLLSSALGPGFARSAPDIFKSVPVKNMALLARMLTMEFNSPDTSSMGRLFDAVSCIAGLRDSVTYEGQAAMELESLFRHPRKDFYPFSLVRENGMPRSFSNGVEKNRAKGRGMLIIDPSQAVLGALADIGKARLVSERFHCGLAAAAVKALKIISSETGIKTVCLSGGVFQNRILLELVIDGLLREGLRAFSNSLVPANDGGISLGQAWCALKKYREKIGSD
ncbi:MAG: carbamoyltransferase HypF [Elusimicrobia bacterium GWF2_52_66]|nr:MAG: carbamoyltransferase HypF [Elusimicrobia bacterium GWA2_51_34]OGR86283.1 MAG: carbamoyltransferase HypF [Elusimicrobia bacterium GWF2_52_66]